MKRRGLGDDELTQLVIAPAQGRIDALTVAIFLERRARALQAPTNLPRQRPLGPPSRQWGGAGALQHGAHADEHLPAPAQFLYRGVDSRHVGAAAVAYLSLRTGRSRAFFSASAVCLVRSAWNALCLFSCRLSGKSRVAISSFSSSHGWG